MSFVRVYDRNLKPMAEIDELNSLVFTKKFFCEGEWELHIPYRNDIHEIINIGMYFLINNDNKKVGVLDNVEVDESLDGVILSGSTLSGVLGRRIIIPPQGDNFYRIDNKCCEDIMYQFVESQCINPQDVKRKLNFLTAMKSKGRGIVANWRASYPNYLNEILYDVGIFSDLGYDMYLDIPNKKWIYEVIQGRDLTEYQTENPNVIFSTNLDNMENVIYQKNEKEYKNAVYALMGDLNKNEFTTYLSRDTYLSDYNLIECYHEASAEAENVQELRKAAEKRKKETVIVETLTGDVIDTLSFKYEKDWFLGDIVTIVHNKAGKILNERITEVTEVYENKNCKLEVVFGIDNNNPVQKIQNLERMVR